MNPDDPVCLCFHVSRRKVLSFIRIEKPRRPSQLSECFGAGTGCGWCRPYLERLLQEHLQSEGVSSDTASKGPNQSVGQEQDLETDQNLESIEMRDYAEARAQYIRDGGGTPPHGATPIEDSN